MDLSRIKKKKTTVETKKLRILRATELIVKKAKAKLKISAEENI